MTTTLEAPEIDTGRRVWFTRDGMLVVLRPIEPGDLELEREFVMGLSQNTAYQRLMSARTPTEAELRRWTEIDHEREAAMIATVSLGGRELQVGVARYVIEPGEDGAEFAIVVSDAMQRSGLGTRLLSELIELARRSGVSQLFGTTFSENLGMLALGKSLGFSRSRVAGAGFLTMLRLRLA